ncbi:MAG TPA: PHP domain-containing protein [Terriglobales bacterium]|nr:PHP domain-containing protein [Terriglobales bacterium]
MIDLHTHSTASDGSLAPAALLDRAAARGVTGLALTDHDTLAGLAEARGRAEAHGIAFLAGIELSTGWRGLDEVHLLGYGVDGAGSGGLAAACGGLRAGRARRAERMVGRLQAAGVGLRLEAVLAEAAGGAVGRPHVARALLAGGWASDMAEAFRRWLVPGTPGYVAQERLETVEGMRLIRAAGGVAVLAHPGTLPLTRVELEAMVAELCGEGLGGIEAYWAKHTPGVVRACEAIAARHQLLATGGSDFHGAHKPEIELGMAAGGALAPALLDGLEGRIALGR